MLIGVELGLRKNWKQFVLLLIVNAFVGGMVGMERTILPQLAEQQFGMASKTAILSFIAVFGLTKAVTNYYTGRFSDRFGRRNLLLAGWLIAIPIPLMLIYAPTWEWVIAANALLRINQGLTWSSTVMMKIDLVGERARGLAMGLNEFSGYLAVGMLAFLKAYLSELYGPTPYPFYTGIFISVGGFLLTAFLIKDTAPFVRIESAVNKGTPLKSVFWETTFKNKTLSAVTQAGLVNNLNDGMIWGLLPVFLSALDYNNEDVGIITATYPMIWGVGQLFTGKMSDHYSKKAMLFWGMLLQGIAIMLIPSSVDFYIFIFLSAALGVGTALVYPTFLTAIAQVTTPMQRAESIGTFRLWRDWGYVFGAITSGTVADIFGIESAIRFVGLLTIFSSLIIQIRIPERLTTNGEVKK
jgi:MFS family permease